MWTKQNYENTLSILTLREEKTGKYYDVLSKDVHVVARAGFSGDLEIPDDMSVSRCHAEISIVKKRDGENVNLYLKLVDKKSKFGTYYNESILNDKAIPSNTPIFLKLNDRIRFGKIGSVWSVKKYPIVVCPSSINRSDKENLANVITKIGGKITKEWSEECTHLCMNTISVTEKALVCLASAKSLVSLKYFIDLFKALLPNSLREIPFCNNYIPPLSESLLNSGSLSFGINNQRKILFCGKTFLCSTVEQLNRISKIVKASGGKIMNYFDCDKSDDDILTSNEYIIMQQDPINTNDSDEYLQILEKLKALGKKSIPETNIALSIMYTSIEKYCNPNYNVDLVNLQSQSNITSPKQPMTLVPDTEMCTIDERKINSVNFVLDSQNTVNESQIHSVNVIPETQITAKESLIHSINLIPDSQSETQNHLKRPLEEITDSENIELSKKRTFLSTTKHDLENKRNNNHVIKEIEQFSVQFEKRDFDPTSSNNYNKFKTSESEITAFNGSSIKLESSLITKPNSIDFSHSKKLSVELQNTIIDQNINNSNNLCIINSNNCTVTERKRKNNSSIFDSEKKNDPFNYMDMDEIDEHIPKKPKIEYSELFGPINTLTSRDEFQSKNFEIQKSCEAADPNFIMNLLADSKSTGHFINTKDLRNKSTINTLEDSKSDDLLNCVIIETINLTVSKPIQTHNNNVQENNSTLKNFKKFKRKGPAMQIPNIIPIALTQLD